MIKILLLTYKDCDNVGDQIIEATVRPLIKVVLADLKCENYDLDSKDIEAVSFDQVSEYHLVIFGGGGIIKYKYQKFYTHVSAVINAAQQCDIPVLLSSVGIEDYDDKDYRCQVLREALNKSCVKQITTRDDIDTLNKYIFNKNVSIAKSADPALYSRYVFQATQKENTSTIGLAVVRDKIFDANGLDWKFNDEIKFWKETIGILEEKGYDYRIFTTGHAGDDLFALKLIKRCKIDSQRYLGPIYTHEKLTDTLTDMSGIIAFRLHAGIVSYSLDVPAINLSWNDKVAMFYEEIGLPERALQFEDWNANLAVERLEEAIINRKEKEKPWDYIYTTYATLFDGISQCLSSSTKDKSSLLTKKRSFMEITSCPILREKPRSIEDCLKAADEKILDIERRYANFELKAMRSMKSSRLRNFAKKHKSNGLVKLALNIRRSIK